MEQLFGDFHPADAAAWKARLEKDLKGITFEQLASTDRNGITVNPFYTREDIGESSPALPLSNDWSICAEIDTADAQQANRQALQALGNGASGLRFLVAPGTDPAILLQDIGLPYIYSGFRLTQAALPFASQLQQYFKEQGWERTQMDCFAGFDCTGSYIQQGVWENGREKAEEAFLTLITDTYPAIDLCIEGALYQDTGATSAYELALLLAHINEYLNLLEAKGNLSAIKRLQVTLATDTSFFEQIARLRAFRKLTALLCSAYGIAPALHLHVNTGNKYRSPFDPYSNLLRDTIAGMAAVTGGCDSLYIRPFDGALEAQGDFGLRIARNQQLIFKEESYLHKVADVAAGSYYLETLTEQLAEKAWVEFQAIENDGGLLASFDKGKVQQEIALQASRLIAEYKEGKRTLIGVNKYPNPKDEPRKRNIDATEHKGLKPLLLADHIL